MRTLRISLPRLRHRLEQLAAIGRESDGGITRLPFSPPHREAVHATASMMAEAGLRAGVDEFGILIGWYEGDAQLPALLVGSHLDTVPHGGMFDGALGVVAGLECAEVLHEAGTHLRHPLAVVAFADEEGAGFGLGTLSARCLLGLVSRPHFAKLQDAGGRSLAEYLSAHLAQLPALRVPDRVAAYLELHVEQGPELYRMGRAVAAVEAITGTLRTTVIFEGRANHAGTTPMAGRADALWGAAEFVLAIRDLTLASGTRAVGTVGQLEVFPGATNIVPGRTEMRVDLRSPDDRLLRTLQTRVADRAAEIARQMGLQVTLEGWDHTPPQPLDPRVREAILRAIKTSGHEPLALPSWAGHDAGIMARYVPAGMIFVSTTEGISHAPQEQAPWPAVEAGANVLLQTLLALDASDDAGRALPLAYGARA